MDLFSILNLLGGLALFLYGIHIMSRGLSKISGGKLERILKKMTSSAFRGIALGAGITIAIQSSSAMTVMLVGLVNSGIMELGQTIGVIMGSNIGTTLTAWILSLSGIESGNVFIRLLKPESFSPIFALAGIIMVMVAKSGKKRDIGKILLGFAVLMFGMEMMTDAVAPLADSPQFSSLIVAFNNPIYGILTGLIFTGIIQSSAASVGVLQALSATGGITFRMAMPIIMGQNIGTCVTALLSSIGTNKNAKRVAAVHVFFNVIGTVVFLALFFALDYFIGFPFANRAASPLGIAIIHSVFNIFTTIILLPFTRQLESLAVFAVRDKNEKEKVELLDDRFLLTPSFAVEHCRTVTIRMAVLARETLMLSFPLLSSMDEKTAQQIEENENMIDTFEDKLGTYLIKISSKSLSIKDSRTISVLLQNIGDFERLGDHAVNLLKSAREMHEKGIVFSEGAREELSVLINAIKEIITVSIDAFEQNDMALAQKAEPLGQVISQLISELKKRHTARLRDGVCTLELGFILSDLLVSFKRVSDHASNIAVCIIQVSEGSFDTHEYLRELKSSDNKQYAAVLREYMGKYALN